jgi:hypothetical protein
MTFSGKTQQVDADFEFYEKVMKADENGVLSDREQVALIKALSAVGEDSRFVLANYLATFRKVFECEKAAVVAKCG